MSRRDWAGFYLTMPLRQEQVAHRFHRRVPASTIEEARVAAVEVGRRMFLEADYSPVASLVCTLFESDENGQVLQQEPMTVPGQILERMNESPRQC